MARLTKKQRAQFNGMKERAEKAERALAALDSFKFSLVEFMREDLEQIARDEAEEILSDAHISY